MTARVTALMAAVLLAAGGGLTWMGDPDREISFTAAGELWSDALRDAGQAGLQFVRVSEKEEMDLGRKLARQYLQASTTDPVWTQYVDMVGKDLARQAVRKGIGYEFHAVDSPSVNAFALPGGQIVVFTGLLKAMRTEGELAAVLGHEIAHVDARHAIEGHQYRMKLGPIPDLAHAIVSQGYAQYQELEADAVSVRILVDSGYDPRAAEAMFRRLMAIEGLPAQYVASTPIDEMIATLSTAADYFRSHPPTPERLRRVIGLSARHARRHPTQAFYVGTENYRRRVPKSKQEFAGEVVRF
ncbi:MAG: M48 family metalloprotease [Bryobacteraceae bacterium]|nr:M48 family metalloprotease [Bryobacteraceae bacterium]